MKNITDPDLFALVLATDEEAFGQGEDPKQRAWSVPIAVMKKLGYESYIMAGVGSPPELERVRAIIKQLYRPQDIGVGGVHLGVFMFRDVFTLIRIPMIMGQMGIDPLQLNDLTPLQNRWLSTNKKQLNFYYDQFTDVFDFGCGLMELGHDRPVSPEAVALMRLAGFQLQAAASAMTVAYDPGGAVQSALIGTELALKAGLVANGSSEAELKGLGHSLSNAARELAIKEPRLDQARVLATLEQFPPYVKNRYAAAQPSRRDTGRIVMGAQYVAAEVMRQFSKRDFRAATSQPLQRTYPPLWRSLFP